MNNAELNEQMDYGMKLLTQADYALHRCVEWQEERNLLSPALREKLKAARKHVAVVYERFQEDCKAELQRQRERAEAERKAKIEAARKEEEAAAKKFEQKFGITREKANEVFEILQRLTGLDISPYFNA